MVLASWQSMQKSHNNGILSARSTKSGCVAGVAVYSVTSLVNATSARMLKRNPVTMHFGQQLPQPELGIRTSGDAMPKSRSRSQVPVDTGKRGRA